MNSIDGLIILLINFISLGMLFTGSMTSQVGKSNVWPVDIADTLKNTIIEQAEAGGKILQQFEQFMLEYGKTYTSLPERMMRFGIFKESLERIDVLMANRKGNVVFGITEFADLTDDEFMRSYSGLSLPQNETADAIRSEHRRSPVGPPSGSKSEGSTSSRGRINFPPLSPSPPHPTGSSHPGAGSKLGGSSDSPPRLKKSQRSRLSSWADENIPFYDTDSEDEEPTTPFKPPAKAAVTRNFYFGDPMKYPAASTTRVGIRNCRACWAFAVATALEILNGQKTGKLRRLSKQQLIDCVKENNGCHGGGFFTPALDFAQQTGLTSSEAYPYVAEDGVCNPLVFPVVYLGGYVRLKGAEDIPGAIRTSPVVVGFNHPPDFKLYRGGVYDPDCSDDLKQFNHAAIIVGYNKDSWIILNNYGPRWGIKGYLLLKRGKCGIGKYAYRLIQGPPVQWG